MNLIQRIFNSIPDCIKIRIFELTNDEKWFLEVEKEANSYFIEEDIGRCEAIKREMEFILDNRKENIRFEKYFLEKIDGVKYSIKLLMGYR